jgi:hypothetical protein
MSGKGSRPRPFSVSLETFDNNFDTIFNKGKSKMQVRVEEDVKEIGKCGCGRSPTGRCIGWHALSEEAFREELAKFEADVQKPVE